MLGGFAGPVVDLSPGRGVGNLEQKFLRSEVANTKEFFMKGKIVLAVVALSVAACSQAQNQGGRALSNANGVVRSVAPKVWNTDKDGRPTDAAAAEREEQQRRARAGMQAQ